VSTASEPEPPLKRCTSKCRQRSGRKGKKVAKTNPHLPDALDDLAKKFGVKETTTGSYLLEKYNKLAFTCALKTQNGKSHSDGYINSWKYYIVPPSQGEAVWMRYLKKYPRILCMSGPGLRKSNKRKSASKGSGNSTSQESSSSDSSSDSDFVEEISVKRSPPPKDETPEEPQSNKTRESAPKNDAVEPPPKNQTTAFSSTSITEPPQKRQRLQKTTTRDPLVHTLEEPLGPINLVNIADKLPKPDTFLAVMANIGSNLNYIVGMYNRLKVENKAQRHEIEALKRKMDAMCAAIDDFQEENREIVFASKFGGKGGAKRYTFRFRSSKFDPEGEHYQCLQNFKEARPFIPEDAIEAWVADFRLKNSIVTPNSLAPRGRDLPVATSATIVSDIVRP
jgi:hypothetical protein